MKRLLKEKRGMTLTELLVALTLLMVIILGTAPVMLNAYDGLYKAGEKTQDSYEAKSEIEDTLATRNSINIVENFKVNFEGLGEVAAINGKRAVSSLENSLETVFTGGRARVAIVSSKIINDDKKSHDVTLQTTNIIFESKEDISYNDPSHVTSGSQSIDISLYLPDKTKNNLASVYATRATDPTSKGILIRNANPATGRIYIEVKGVDFTNSPAKIEITYRDENDKVKKTSCYLTIKTPTIMAVGTTTYGDYYTSAGVETFKNPDGTTYNKLMVDERRMDIDGTKSGYTKPIPSGTVFKNVTWITEQTATTGEFVDSVYEPNYYVITGTNGAIYRTYSFTGYNTQVVGRVNPSFPGNDANGYTAKHHALAAQLGADVIGIADAIYTLDDAKSTIVYPAVWGGDFSHVYAYSGYNKSAGYLNNDAWYTEVGNSGIGQEGYYSNFVNFQYYYNGYGFNYSYTTQNSRKLSYILTELPYSLRVGGFMEDCGDFDMGHNRIWERPIKWNDSGTAYTSAQEVKNTKSLGEGYWYMNAPGTADEKVIRCAIVKDNASEWDYDEKYLNEIPTYWANNSWTGGDQGRWGDSTWAQLRLKGITTVSPNFLYEQRGLNDNSISSYRFAYNTTTNQPKIVVTDSVYIPGKGVFYVGTVATYAVVNQLDSVSTDVDYGKTIRNKGDNNDGGITTYYIMGNDEGTSTTIHKYSSSMWGRDESDSAPSNLTVFKNKTVSNATPVKVNSDESREFFVCRSYGGQKTQVFDDLYFTMGFTSNREMVYSKIVYGKNESGAVVEAMKSYEPLYFLSHYDDVNATHFANCYMNDYAATKSSVVDEDKPNNSSNGYTYNVTGGYFNVMDNDYYNVWFPGEMYNLTKVATKDGISVAVGYAVSGSTYTWMNPNQTTNSSTALGSVYNDGVLAAIRLGADTSFTNLLYFKDQSGYRSKGVDSGFDDLSLADGSVTDFAGGKSYRNVLAGGDTNWNYGTHARASVQFTAVDISVESVLSANNEVSTYYAYYADNRGRLYKSKVATKTTPLTATTNSTPQLVSHIADEPYDGSRNAPSYMEEIKINGNSLGSFFSKITTVSCDGDYIIVGGHTKESDSNFYLVIGKIEYQYNDDGNPVSTSVTWRYGKIGGAAAYQLEDAVILDGYVYLAGVSVSNPNITRGFVCALPLEQSSQITNGGDLPFDANLFVGDDQLQDRIYSIDGHK
ncbi:MAG: type II secretion system protein [Ruminococcaceae bacterium]|nr:type II secretion system protein [Oscillospiraceae bacterium]